MRSKTKMLTSAIVVCFMVFAMIPWMGNLTTAYGASAVQFVERTPEITNANGNVGYEYAFEADETNQLKARATHVYYSASSSGSDYRMEIIDSTGAVIASADGSNELVVTQFPKADAYKLALYSGQNHMGYSIYELAFDLAGIHNYTGAFTSFDAVVGNYTEGSVYEYAQYYVKLSVGDYDGNDELVRGIYREDLATGQFYATDPSTVVWDDAVEMGAKYRYYVVNKTLLDYASEMPEKYTAKGISAEAKAELQEKATTVDVEVPGPTVQTVSDLKVTAKGIKTATVTWWWSSDGQPGYVTGYELIVFNSKGKKVGKPVYAADGRVGTTLTIPYEGKSTIQVTPYYNYNGKGYFGEPKKVTVTSAKMKAPSMNVTKITGTKAKITTYRDPAELGVQIQQKVGGKWKVVTNKGTAKVYKKTWTKNKAGSTQYRVRAYLKDAGKTYYSPWRVVKPKKNQFVYSTNSISYYRNYYGKDTYFEPAKIFYSGSKIKLTCKFYNAWSIVDDSCKVKVTFYEGKKAVGSKTISSGNIAASEIKTKTVTLDKSKTGTDLRTITYKVKYLK